MLEVKQSQAQTSQRSLKSKPQQKSRTDSYTIKVHNSAPSHGKLFERLYKFVEGKQGTGRNRTHDLFVHRAQQSA